jgi:NADH dehydrogenase FAD-containing subunit
VSSLGEDALNGHGFVKIKPTMQLLNHPSIFALGDIIDWTEQKQIAKLIWHVPVVVANVASFLNGVAPMKKYAGASEIIVITNGKVSQKPGVLLWFGPDTVVIERRHGLLWVLWRVYPG